MTTFLHDSDCALHNAPALPVGPCSCGMASHEWQPMPPRPIETALISKELLVCGGTFTSDADDWNDKFEFTGVALVIYCTGIKEGWRGGQAGRHDEFFWYQPTHYLELPELPKVQ